MILSCTLVILIGSRPVVVILIGPHPTRSQHFWLVLTPPVQNAAPPVHEGAERHPGLNDPEYLPPPRWGFTLTQPLGNLVILENG